MTSSADSGGKVEVVFEEGAQSAWLYKLLKPLVSSAPVCDPRHNKLIIVEGLDLAGVGRSDISLNQVIGDELIKPGDHFGADCAKRERF